MLAFSQKETSLFSLPVCVPAPPGVFEPCVSRVCPGFPRCLFTGATIVVGNRARGRGFARGGRAASSESAVGRSALGSSPGSALVGLDG